MKYRFLLLTAAIAACDGEPTGSIDADFSATVRGARTLNLSGDAWATRVYAEIYPTGRHSIVLSSTVQDGRGRPIILDCPEDVILQVRTHTLGTDIAGCRAFYRLVETDPVEGPVAIEEAVSTTGTIKISRVTATQISGTFQFSGPLEAGDQNLGTVNVSGDFTAERN